MRVKLTTLYFILLMIPNFALACVQPPTYLSQALNHEERRFSSLLVAVHGYKGSCDATFGSEERNLFNYLALTSAFDSYCFDYDVDEHNIHEAKACLERELVDRLNEGYNEVSFVTHSTGGLIVLDLVLEQANSAIEKIKSGTQPSELLFRAENGLRLQHVSGWGFPINGARLGAIWAGNVVDQEGVIDDLKPGSEFLKNLHSKLNNLDKFKADNPLGFAKVNFELSIRQGNQDDWVVKGINPATETWWPKNFKINFLLTESPHLFNVKNGVSEPTREDIGSPKYPAQVEKSDHLLNFKLQPRFSPYFTPLANEVNGPTFAERQRELIVNGIFDYARYPALFDNSQPALSGLIVQLYTGGFDRSAAFDEVVVEKLISVLADVIQSSSSREALYNASSLIADFNKLLSEIDFNENSVNQFGGGSKLALRQLACDLRTLVQLTLAKYPNPNDVPLNLKSVYRNLEVDLYKATLQFFKAARIDPTVENCAIDIATNIIRDGSTGAIENADYHNQLLDYQLRTAGLVGQQRKEELGNLLIEVSERSAKIKQEIYQEILKPAPWFGNPQAGKWSQIFNDEQVKRFSSSNVPELSDFEFSLNNQIVGQAGASGQNRELIREALSSNIDAYLNTPSLQNTDKEFELQNAIKISPFPGLVDQALRVEEFNRNIVLENFRNFE